MVIIGATTPHDRTGMKEAAGLITEIHKLSATPFSHRHPLLRRLGIDFVFTCIFNVLVALAITHLARFGTSFATNLVFSMCIGILALLIIDGGRLLLWREEKPGWPIFLLIAGAVPLAYYGGHALAVRLLGMDSDTGHGMHLKLSSGSMVATLLACLLGTWFFWSRGKVQYLEAQAAKEKERTAAIEKQALQAQLQMLQAQIEPHMLFNTLANLQALIGFDTQRAQRMLDQLIQYLRATLSSARAPHTTLAQEFVLLQVYLELMAIRMGQRLTYSLDLPAALRDVALPPMLLQPLVENAIKHGIEPKVDGGRIDVTAREDGGMLELTVADTGIGVCAPGMIEATEMTEATGLHDAVILPPGAGVGLDNVRERLHVLFGERAAFSLQDNQPAGTIARLTLPMTT